MKTEQFTRETTDHTETQKRMADMAVDYANNYLTVARFAEHHSIPHALALAMIEEGKKILAGEGCLY